MKPEGSSPSLGELVADCKSAIRYLRAHSAELGIDPEKIVVAGDSAGGHLAGALVAVTGFDDPGDNTKISSVPNAAVLCNAIVDLTDGNWINYAIGGTAIGSKTRVEPSEEQMKAARALSPLFQVRAGLCPTLVMHGTEDRVVLPEQSRKFAEAMKVAGNKSELRMVEGARHAFVVTSYTAPEARVVDVMREIDKWITGLGYLQGEPTLEVSAAPAWAVRVMKNGGATSRPSK
jgi:acetyl esterase/lipase